MSRVFLVLGACYGFIGLALGAFGAHALRDRIEPRALEVFETAVRYQLVHALALLVVGLLLTRTSSGWIEGSGWAFTGGILVFSGSLFALALTGVGRFGAVTPLGGLALLAGWALLIVGAWTLGAGAGGSGGP